MLCGALRDRYKKHDGAPIRVLTREYAGLLGKNSEKIEFAIVCTTAYNRTVYFEWNEEKNASNYKKHRVWFEEAQTVWADPQSVEFHDPEHSVDEDRFIRIGHSTQTHLLLIVFCERDAGKTIRIISARKTTPKERKQYEEGI